MIFLTNMQPWYPDPGTTSFDITVFLCPISKMRKLIVPESNKKPVKKKPKSLTTKILVTFMLRFMAKNLEMKQYRN